MQGIILQGKSENSHLLVLSSHWHGMLEARNGW